MHLLDSETTTSAKDITVYVRLIDPFYNNEYSDNISAFRNI